MIEAMKNRDDAVIYENMVNVLEEYTLKQYKEVQQIKDKIAAETTAEKVLMTGSGPTVFALFEKLSEAQKACKQMCKEGYEAYWATTY